MSKRKLSQQQTFRIEKRRKVDLDRSTQIDDSSHEHREGLVLSHFGKQADVEDSQNNQVIRCHLRANLGALAAGDRVKWVPDGEGGVVTALFPRHSELHRPDAFGKLRLVAANITQMVITLAPEPQAHANLIDRYLVVAETLGFTPLLLLNKQELLVNHPELMAMMATYQRLGYRTIFTSAKQPQGCESLEAELKPHTSIFVGQSGVGKSSIVQNLIPLHTLKIGELSDQVQKGRHTTTYARLYHFPFGGHCIDSPGIREFGLWHLTQEQVVQGFIEFREPSSQCRFNDCKHHHEPGCGILKALQQGDISPVRYQSYQYIVASLAAVNMQNNSF